MLPETQVYVLCISSVLTTIFTEENVNMIGHNQQLPFCAYLIKFSTTSHTFSLRPKRSSWLRFAMLGTSANTNPNAFSHLPNAST